MAKDYSGLAKTILNLVGGEKNVSQLEHCSTRLRFSIVDGNQVKRDELKATSGVMGVVGSGAQCQVVIGNDVIEVYDELMKLGNFKGGSDAPAAKEPFQWKNLGSTILDYMVGIFQPLVPAIAGAGILKALMTLCSTFGWLETTDVLYRVLNGVGDAALYYLPILVAITTATKFGSNKLVAVALAAAMIHPNTAALLATEGGAKLFGLTLQNIGYTGQVFPSILIIIAMSFLEKWSNKWCPKAIRVFFVPLLCFAICFPLGLLLLGPLGYNIGALLTKGILWLYGSLGWLAVAIVAAILPFMISLGMHKALVPYAVSSISSPGFDMLYLPASLAHNISEGGACLAVAVKTKDPDLKAAAISAGVSGLFGITEPALYGVTLQRKKVLLSVVASSFIGGLFIGIMKIKGFAAVGPGVASMPMYIDPDNSMNFVWAWVALGISVVCSFIFTFIFFKDDLGALSKAPASTGKDLVSPMVGKVVDISEVPDPVFAEGTLGDGMAVIPAKGELYAPADATVNSVFETKHAITLTCDNGAELLIHVGLDTVKLKGQFFDVQVKAGDKVKKGQLLMRFDMKGITKAGYQLITPIVVTNADDFKLTKATNGSVGVGSGLMALGE